MLSCAAELRREGWTLNAALMSRWDISCIGGNSQDRTWCSECAQSVFTLSCSLYVLAGDHCDPSIGDVLWIEWMPRRGRCALVQIDTAHIHEVDLQTDTVLGQVQIILCRAEASYKMHVSIFCGLKSRKVQFPLDKPNRVLKLVYSCVPWSQEVLHFRCFPIWSFGPVDMHVIL